MKCIFDKRCTFTLFFDKVHKVYPHLFNFQSNQKLMATSTVPKIYSKATINH